MPKDIYFQIIKKTAQSQAFKKDKNIKSVPCQFYNKGTCTHTATHETKGVLYRHIYSACFSKNGTPVQHADLECQNKKKVTKTE